MAGIVEPRHEDFYNARIKPDVDGKDVEYFRLLSQAQLAPICRKAAGVLFVIKWCEPFGRVAGEARASGTPLIAARLEALPETICQAETGFVVDSIEEAIRATERLLRLSPAACRADVKSRFGDKVMAKGYEAVYHLLG